MEYIEDAAQQLQSEVTDFEHIAILEQRFGMLMGELREIIKEWYFERSGQAAIRLDATVIEVAISRLLQADDPHLERADIRCLSSGSKPTSVRLPVFRGYAKS